MKQSVASKQTITINIKEQKENVFLRFKEGQKVIGVNGRVDEQTECGSPRGATVAAVGPRGHRGPQHPLCVSTNKSRCHSFSNFLHG